MFTPKPMTPDHSRSSLVDDDAADGVEGEERAEGEQLHEPRAAAAAFSYVEPDEAAEAAAAMAAAAAARREARAAMEPCAAHAPFCMEGCAAPHQRQRQRQRQRERERETERE
jgi:hypothetical protein